MRQLQNEPEKLRSFYQTIAQICRLTVHLLMDRLIVKLTGYFLICASSLLPQQLRQLGDVGCDPPGLVVGETFACRASFLSLRKYV